MIVQIVVMGCLANAGQRAVLLGSIFDRAIFSGFQGKWYGRTVLLIRTQWRFMRL